MPLTDDEKIKIREAEVLRNDIRRELKDAPEGSKVSRFFQHQAVLLMLGFLLTTTAGSWLTFLWKQRDWRNQQSVIEKRRVVEKKSALIERTFKETALTMTAAEDVLNTYYGDRWSPRDIDYRWGHWYLMSEGWRVNSKVLDASIAGVFSSEVQSEFERLVDRRRLLGNAIGNLPKRKGHAMLTNALYKDIEHANDLVNQLADSLKVCGTKMSSETK